MNTFGQALKLTSFGESHGAVIGGVLDGLPSNLAINFSLIDSLIQKRQGGRNAFVTPRKEKDRVEFLSGIYEGKSTGAPIAFLVQNQNTQSKDYQREIFRPSHADFTYFHKYSNVDFRGGGRSSARETLVRVIASGLVAPLLENIEIESGVLGIGGIECSNLDFAYAKESEIFSLDKESESKQKQILQEAIQEGDSLGGVVLLRARGDLLGLGEPLYGKLDAKLAEAMMGINGVKAVEIGEGVKASQMRGSTYNDSLTPQGFMSNHSGGILGGIANGEEILLKVHFKPTASIALPQKSINHLGESVQITIKGRHDPCIAIRGSIVAEAMLRLVLADMIMLRQRGIE